MKSYAAMTRSRAIVVVCPQDDEALVLAEWAASCVTMARVAALTEPTLGLYKLTRRRAGGTRLAKVGYDIAAVFSAGSDEEGKAGTCGRCELESG